MPAVPRPRRSVLFMPASNARAVEKARTLAADGLIFDLEDAVAAAAMPIDAVVLPKVESADTVRQAQGLAAGKPVWCMIETPRGVLRAADIAAACAPDGGLIMGTADLTKDLRARHTPDRAPLRTVLGLCLLAARAYGLPILDGVHLDLGDDEGFAEACRQGRDLGFDGKTLIHPKTIATANAIFAPAAEEVAQARRVVAAYAEAVAAGKGVVLVDGRLIENLHVEEASHVVALAEAIAARDVSMD